MAEYERLSELARSAPSRQWPRRRRSPAEVRAWLRQARAERATGEVLDRLTAAGYHVLHDRVLPGNGQIDHLVIGTTGVFIIETRIFRGGFQLHGTVLSHRDVSVHQLTQELANRTGHILDAIAAQLGDVHVRGWHAVAVHGAQLPPGIHAADNVALVPYSALAAFVLSLPHALDPLRVAAIAAAAEAALPAAGAP